MTLFMWWAARKLPNSAEILGALAIGWAMLLDVIVVIYTAIYFFGGR